MLTVLRAKSLVDHDQKATHKEFIKGRCHWQRPFSYYEFANFFVFFGLWPIIYLAASGKKTVLSRRFCAKCQNDKTS